MRKANPSENIGVILSRDGETFLGSCFAFRYPHTVITAHHVLISDNVTDALASFPGSRAGETAFQVKEIASHETADVSILTIDPPDEQDITWTFNDLFDDFYIGGDLMTYGYPADVFVERTYPSPRCFRGYTQRFLNHKSHLGYTYLAAELSFACPGGLSGAPIFDPNVHGRLCGLVTENLKTSTEVESIREVNDDGSEFRETYHNVINYGVAVWLPKIGDWVDSITPPVLKEEINRRAANQKAWEND